jgi:hypothetical protein
MERGARAQSRFILPLVGAIVIVGVIAFILGSRGTPAPSPQRPSPSASEAAESPTLVPATASPEPTAESAFPRNPAPIVEGVPYSQDIDPADFVSGIDHPFFPLAVGTKWVYDGAEHVEVEVLPDSKEILGVAVTVVRDRVFEDGAMIEDTLDWYAQDVDGNVWYFGEETAELEGGEVVSTAGSWEAGIDGAQPGIIMLADPQVGDEYRQEFYEGEAEDMAAVTALSGSITVPAGSWSGSDVLVTEEWTPLEPDIRERKTYARGVGLVETRTIKGGDEVTTLTRVDAPGTAALSVSVAGPPLLGPVPTSALDLTVDKSLAASVANVDARPTSGDGHERIFASVEICWSSSNIDRQKALKRVL